MKKLFEYEMVLFDVDGTLLDTSKGIINSVKYAEKMLSLKPLESEKYKLFIGPPPKYSYIKNYGISEELAEKATFFHREYGKNYGIFESCVYKQIDLILKQINHMGMSIGVCTLKRQDITEKILQYHNIYQYFDIIVGMDKNESMKKEDMINSAIRKLQCNKDKVVMIGDSKYDYNASKKAGIDFLGVLYGFGFEEKKDYAFDYVKNTQELLSLCRE